MSYIAWHFSDGHINYGDGREIKQGQTYAVKWPYRGMMEPKLCSAGFHGSLRAIDALRYAEGPIVSLCEIYGRVKIGEDKICGDSRRALYIADASNLLFEFACWAAEEALKARMAEGYTFDPAPFAAIQARRDFQAGKITKQELSAARSAAEVAARSDEFPPWGELFTPWSNTWYGARYAKWAAARAATWAAEDFAAEGCARSVAAFAARSVPRDVEEGAAWAAARTTQNDELEKRLRQLFNI